MTVVVKLLITVVAVARNAMIEVFLVYFVFVYGVSALFLIFVCL